MELDWLRRNITHGLIRVTGPDGTDERIGHGKPEVHWQVRDPRAMAAVARDPAQGFARSYVEGAWSVVDGEDPLLKLLVILMRNFPQGLQPERPEGRWGAIRHAAGRLRPARSTRPVCDYQWDEWLARHILGPELDHGCGYFDPPALELAQAQQAQARHLGAKLLIEPGQHVLDIGCGWGSLAVRLAHDYDVHVTGLTADKDRLRLAHHAAAQQGVDDRVTFRLGDYDTIADERFDRVVSVGLLETLTQQARKDFASRVRQVLTSDGVAVVQTTARIAAPDRPGGWINGYAYPGCVQPALSAVFEAIEHSELLPIDTEILRMHGARTLQHWRKRLQQHASLAAERKGETVARRWAFCLAASEAAFRYGDLTPVQIQLARRGDAVPLTRDYLYTT